MIGPRHLETPKEKVLHDMDYQKHVRKLEEIKKVEKKGKPLSIDVDVRDKINQIRLQSFKFQHFERSQNIDKDNQVLLGRLVEISRQKPKLNSTQSEAVLPKTLNAPYRKKELERIASENEALARRLLSQNSKFNIRKLEQDFEKHLALLKNVQKLNYSPTPKGKLPPLTVESTKAKDAKKIKLPEKVSATEKKPEVKSESRPEEKADEKKEAEKPAEKGPEEAIQDETEPNKDKKVEQAADKNVTSQPEIKENKVDPTNNKAPSMNDANKAGSTTNIPAEKKDGNTSIQKQESKTIQ